MEAEVLQRVEAQTRAVLEAVAQVHLQGEQQRVMLERLEDAVVSSLAPGCGGARGCCQEPSGVAIAETPDCGASGAAVALPGRDIRLDQDGASLLRGSDSYLMLEPVMPTAPADFPPPADASPARAEDAFFGTSPARHSRTVDGFYSFASESTGTERRTWWEEEVQLRRNMQRALRADWLGASQASRSKMSPRRAISTVAKEEMLARQRFLKSLVESHHFDTFCGVVIMLNALCMGLQANHRAMHPEDRCPGVYAGLDFAFNVFFLLEVAVRMACLRKGFFKGIDWQWNVFDLAMVCLSLFEEVIQLVVVGNSCGKDEDVGKGVTALRIIRVLRLIRIIRAVRVMRLFRELRVMVRSILRCLVPLCWASMLLLVIQWCFSVYFVHISADYVADRLSSNPRAQAADDTTIANIQQQWGSLWQALYTLFQSVTGGMDWGGAADSMLVVGYHPVLLYVGYVALTVFAVLNVVTGVFVENAMKMALQDRDLQIQDQLERRQECVKNLLKIFHEADADRDGRVSQAEFEAHLEDQSVQAFLNCLELTGVEARRLFRLLDISGSGFVDAEEFVTGCMYLRGGAKTMDVVALMLEHRKFVEHVSAEIEQLKVLAEQARRATT